MKVCSWMELEGFMITKIEVEEPRTDASLSVIYRKTKQVNRQY